MSKRNIFESHYVKPFSLLRPDEQTSPFVFSSPHSGHFYPDRFMKQSKLMLEVLRSSEDAFVDELYSEAPFLGSEMITATYPRAFIDINRGVDELDEEVLTAPLPYGMKPNITERVEAGFGIIPKVVAYQIEIYKEPLDYGEAFERITRIYEPYHFELDNMLNKTSEKFGWACLIDCHSMPSFAVLNAMGGRQKYPFNSGLRTIDMVLGDGKGATCDPRVTNHVARHLRGLGYHVVLNDPYAGGFCTRHYGKPTHNIHALQIEINRSLYMDETKIIKRPQAFRQLKNDLTGMIKSLSKIDLFKDLPLAAE
jgi:N-formylglutamate amidohydrolase